MAVSGANVRTGYPPWGFVQKYPLKMRFSNGRKLVEMVKSELLSQLLELSMFLSDPNE
jgi:hypothetical protein